MTTDSQKKSDITIQTYALMKTIEKIASNDSGEFSQIREDLFLKFHVRSILDFIRKGKDKAEWLDPETFSELSEFISITDSKSQLDFKKKYGASILPHLQSLHEFLDSSNRKGTFSRDLHRVQNRLHMEAIPQINLSHVKNLVLAGGGAKTMSLSGILCALDNNPEVSIHRVAGTSGGAILAMAYAIGVSGDKIKEIVTENNFGIFTIGSRADSWAMNLFIQYKAKDDPTHILHAATDIPFYKTYHAHMVNELKSQLRIALEGSTSSVLSSVRGLMKVIEGSSMQNPASIGLWLSSLPKKVLQDIEKTAKSKALRELGIDTKNPLWTVSAYPDHKTAVQFAIRSHLGLDLIKEFLADIIESRLSELMKSKPFLIQTFFSTSTSGAQAKLPGMHELRARFRNLTFQELYELHQISMTDFRELHVSMCVRRHAIDRLTKDRLKKYRAVDASHESVEFSDLPIVEAVRVSMNLPGIYPEYKFTLSGVEYGGVDGGLLSNLSMDTFDTHKTIEPSLLGPQSGFVESSSRKYRKMDTIGVFYKTAKELINTTHFSHVLSSNKSINTLELEADEIKKELSELYQLRSISNIPASKLKKTTLSIAKKQGKLAAIELEIKNKIYESTGINRIKNALNNYLQKKNSEYGHRSVDVRRLVMVNTGEVDTAHFKLSLSVKEEQFRQGYVAGTQFLSKEHCLETEFYRQKIISMGPTESNILHEQDTLAYQLLSGEHLGNIQEPSKITVVKKSV